jgi:hypothetical protein
VVEEQYATLDHGGARWKLRLLAEAARCALSPGLTNRHRLARLASTIHTPDGRAWPVQPP